MNSVIILNRINFSCSISPSLHLALSFAPSFPRPQLGFPSIGHPLQGCVTPLPAQQALSRLSLPVACPQPTPGEPCLGGAAPQSPARLTDVLTHGGGLQVIALRGGGGGGGDLRRRRRRWRGSRGGKDMGKRRDGVRTEEKDLVVERRSASRRTNGSVLQ